MRIRRPRRRTLAIGIGVVLVPVLLVTVANAIVVLGGRSGADGVADAPRAQAALVLGAGVTPDGRLTPMLADRVEVAARLYRAGKVEKVLASGDHGRVGYDEVNAMRRALLDAGVPARDVFTDHAGFDSWSSAVRAQKVFRVRSALVVTQGFHLPRAVWLARRAGLDAEGVSADLRDYGRATEKSEVREVLARTKALGEVLVGREPRYLGEPVPITGDGRASVG